MTIKIIANISGFFVFDNQDKLIEFTAYEKNPEKIAEKIHNLSKYTISEELENIFSDLKEKTIETNSADVQNFSRSKGIKSELIIKSENYQAVISKIPEILIQKNYIKDDAEYTVLLKDVSINLSKKSVAYSSQRIDKNVVHAILSMDDIDKTTNLFSSRIREWYGVHFPEILKEVQNHVTLCKIVTEIGTRQKFTENGLKDYGFSIERSKKLVQLASKSMGASYEDKDLRPLQDMAQKTLDLYEERENLESWIEREMGRIAPNMKAVVGSSIAARLIALAGGLREIAMKPASTVQLLGAEKALFRALKTGAKPPKHGIIYQMPEIHSCPWWQRGNISRAIAGRLTIAARIDFFQGEFYGDQLRIEVEQKIDEIKEKYKNPPEGKQPPVDRSFQPDQQRPKRGSYKNGQKGGQRSSQRGGQRKPPYKKPYQKRR
ncbi:MAG: C/D box methylation guide ribonucleoprotein complex aNOP56 subunit [Candidatus Heimdallarchaeota archaeon]|nr:C/D box methylation guide ribonucleoprotein complex aNOP56 subunit [Candidatus Heimdallarchaeota archaeon]